MVKCQETLPVPKGKTGADVLPVMLEWGAMYHECMVRHNGLVDSFKVAR